MTGTAATIQLRPASLALCALLLGACSSSGPQAPEGALRDFDRAAAVAAVRAAGTAAGGELEIQPLRDPQVEDLRAEAVALEQRGAIQAAADALDRALAINADDPALLQERAELALLLGEVDAAERLALRAFELGSQVGPLCRRHWETAAQVRLARLPVPVPVPGVAAQAPAGSVEAARARRDACTVGPPDRF